MNKNSITLNFLQSQCRDAALGELPWEVLLSNICCWVGGDKAMLLSAQLGKPYTCTASYNHDLADVSAYNREFNGNDPRMPFSKLTLPGQTRTGQQYVLNSKIANTDYFNLVYKRADQLDSLHSVILDSPSSGRQSLSIHRSFKNELFARNELDRMEALLPHLIDAYEYSGRISGRISHTFETQDCAFLIKPDLRTVLLNGNPQKVLLGNPSFRWNGKHLRVGSKAFQRFLSLAIQRGLQGFSSKCRIQIAEPQRFEAGEYLEIMLYARPELIDWMPDANESVVLYVARKQQAQSTQNCELFADIFSLTKSEGHALSSLLKTRSLKASALNSDLSYETMRWHLKNIFLKTGYNNQEDLFSAVVDMDISNAQ